MTDIPQEKNEESKIFGVSARAFMAIQILTTVCIMSVLKFAIVEPLYTLSSMALGFYFGQKTLQPKP